MTTMTSHYLTCAGREIHYTLWGADNSQTLIMWHGLARTGRDFDHVAAHFADHYRVICPDTLGRGMSQWAEDEKEYCLDFYSRIAHDLLDHHKVDALRWIGTSMGGALGMKLASSSLKGRISHLVMNDFGPEPTKESVERILSYAGNPPEFDTVTELENFLRTVYAPFGEMTDAQWRLLAETSTRRKDNGKVTVHYDPRMVRQFVNYPNDYILWDAYDQVEAKALLLRGADSDLLPRDWAQQMTQRGPKCRLVEIEGCGHAPPLNTPEQLSLLEEFLAN